MKICFDGFPLSHLPSTDLYSYSYNLINGLLDIYPHPKYHIISNNGGTLPFEKNKGLAIDFMDINRRHKDYSLISEYLKRNKIKLYHCLNNGFSLPHDKCCKYVITIHDLLPLENKGVVDDKYYSKFMGSLPKAVDNADKVIVVSNFIAKQLRKSYGVSEEKIETIYPAIGKQFKPIWGVHYKNFLSKKYNINGKFLLYVGSIHKRQNLELVLETFKKILKVESNLKLLLIGDTSGKRRLYYEKLKEYVDKMGLTDKVHFIGPVSSEDLPYFYNAAQSYINLSSYEGFPLTAVEAKYCETPIICRDNSSFKEVLGDYPVYTDSSDPEEMAEVVLKTMGEPARPLFLKSKEQNINNFSESIRKVISLYEDLMYTW